MTQDVKIPGPKIYADMLQELEYIGYVITPAILDLCDQIDKELDKQNPLPTPNIWEEA